MGQTVVCIVLVQGVLARVVDGHGPEVDVHDPGLCPSFSASWHSNPRSPGGDYDSFTKHTHTQIHTNRNRIHHLPNEWRGAFRAVAFVVALLPLPVGADA